MHRAYHTPGGSIREIKLCLLGVRCKMRSTIKNYRPVIVDVIRDSLPCSKY